jgi:hypothetical protein
MNVRCADCGTPTVAAHVPAQGTRVLARCDACKRREENAVRVAIRQLYEGDGTYGGTGGIKIEPHWPQSPAPSP